MKTFIQTTAVLALTSALTLLSAPAGHCSVHSLPLSVHTHYTLAYFVHHLLIAAARIFRG